MDYVLALQAARISDLGRPCGNHYFFLEDGICFILDTLAAAAQDTCGDPAVKLQKVIGRANNRVRSLISDVAVTN